MAWELTGQQNSRTYSKKSEKTLERAGTASRAFPGLMKLPAEVGIGRVAASLQGRGGEAGTGPGCRLPVGHPPRRQWTPPSRKLRPTTEPGRVRAGSVVATTHSATRSFSAASVLPGEPLKVTIEASQYGCLGEVLRWGYNREDR